MESMNKFKVLTIIVICMFLFVVAAIYSNTKDASQGKLETKNQAAKARLEDSIKSNLENSVQNNNNSSDLTVELEMLNRRIDELGERVTQQDQASKGGTGLNCRIYGTMTQNGIEQLTPESAVQEAKVNNNDIVITCSF